MKKKTIDDMEIRIPLRRLRDGTHASLKKTTMLVYHCLAGYKNYKTNESRVNYSTIRRDTGIGSGARIKAAIDELVEADLIDTWLIQKTKRDHSPSKHTKRRYRIKE